LIVEIEPERISNAHIQISEGWIETGPEDFSGAFQDCNIGEFAAGDLVLAEAKRAQFVDQLKEWRANNSRIVIYFQTEGEIERFRKIMAGTIEGAPVPAFGGQLLQQKETGSRGERARSSGANQPPAAAGGCHPGLQGVDFVEGTLTRGFCFPAANLVVLSAAELFGRFAVHPRRP